MSWLIICQATALVIIFAIAFQSNAALRGARNRN
jgi:hypothetical protein